MRRRIAAPGSSKVYVAKVRGRFPSGEGAAAIACNAALRNVRAGGEWRVEAHALGKPARTLFARLSYCASSDTSVVEARLTTGRTHQIRVHLAHLGFPISNDPLYCAAARADAAAATEATEAQQRAAAVAARAAAWQDAARARAVGRAAAAAAVRDATLPAPLLLDALEAKLAEENTCESAAGGVAPNASAHGVAECGEIFLHCLRYSGLDAETAEAWSYAVAPPWWWLPLDARE